MKLIDKDALVAEIENIRSIEFNEGTQPNAYACMALDMVKDVIDTLEVKEVGLIIHTIIAECCDWLAMNTNLSHDEIEGCRNLMLTVKDDNERI